MIFQLLIAHQNQVCIKKILQLINSHEGNEYACAYNGFDALEYCINHRPKLIFVEEDLPGLNAYDIQKALRIKRIKSKLIILKPENFRSTENLKKMIAQSNII